MNQQDTPDTQKAQQDTQKAPDAKASLDEVGPHELAALQAVADGPKVIQNLLSELEDRIEHHVKQVQELTDLLNPVLLDNPDKPLPAQCSIDASSSPIAHRLVESLTALEHLISTTGALTSRVQL